MNSIVTLKELDTDQKYYFIEKEKVIFIITPMYMKGRNVFEYTKEENKYYVRGQMHVLDKIEGMDVKTLIERSTSVLKMMYVQYIRKDEKWCL